MSDLVYQNYNNRCKGWTPPSSLTGPQINSLSGYQSPAGSSTVVSISGVNFFSYSTILFGTFTPTTYFINSNIIQFYIPNTLSSGTFPVQVFNGSIPSNIVTYTIDNASGYWLLNPGGSISNTNSNGVQVSWLSRGAPVTLDNSQRDFTLSNPYIVPNNVNWIICSDQEGSGDSFYIQLPSGTIYDGREITIKTLGSGNVLTSNGKTLSPSIIVPFDGSNAQNIIVLGEKNEERYWSTLVYDAYTDGGVWEIMQSNWQSPP